MSDDELMTNAKEFDDEILEICGDFEIILNDSSFGFMYNFTKEYMDAGGVGAFRIMSEFSQRMHTMTNLLNYDFIRSYGYDRGGSRLYFWRDGDILTIKEVTIEERFINDGSQKYIDEYKGYYLINHIPNGLDWIDYIEPDEVRMEATVSFNEFIIELNISSRLFLEEVFTVNPLLRDSRVMNLFERQIEEFKHKFAYIIN